MPGESDVYGVGDLEQLSSSELLNLSSGKDPGDRVEFVTFTSDGKPGGVSSPLGLMIYFSPLNMMR